MEEEDDEERARAAGSTERDRRIAELIERMGMAGVGHVGRRLGSGAWSPGARLAALWVSAALCAISLAALAGYLQDLKHRRRHGGVGEATSQIGV